MKLVNFSNNPTLTIKKCLKILNEGGIIVYPTETLYGLGGNALLGEVWEKIYQIKEIREKKPFILLVRDLKMIESLFGPLPLYVRRFLENIWPDNVSVIIETQKQLMGFSKIAFRVSSHPFLYSLFKEINFPIISTSVNKTGKNSILKIEEIDRDILEKVDLIIDDKILPSGFPSTLISINQDQIFLLREGIVCYNKLVEIFKKIKEEDNKL